MTFQLVEAGELMARRNGSVDPAKFPNEEFELHSIPAFDAGRPDLLRGSQIGSSKQIVQPDDVMISKIVPHIRRSAVVGTASGKRQIASGEWIVFRSERVFPHYLRHYLVSDEFNAKFMRTVSGVGGSLLRARPAEVGKIKIPLPPLSEQRRIAMILDKADALRAKRREAIAKLDQLLQAAFIDMFRDPSGMERVPLQELACPSRNSFTNGPFGSDLLASELVESGVPVVYIRDIRDGVYARVSTVCVTPEKAEKIKACNVAPGDLLISKVGDPPGVAAIYPDSAPAAVVTQDVIRLRVNKGRVTARYLWGLLNSEVGRRLVKPIIVEATRARFSLRDLKGLEVPVPSLDIQEKFGDLASKVERQSELLVESMRRMDAASCALQHRAFSGAL